LKDRVISDRSMNILSTDCEIGSVDPLKKKRGFLEDVREEKLYKFPGTPYFLHSKRESPSSFGLNHTEFEFVFNLFPPRVYGIEQFVKF